MVAFIWFIVLVIIWGVVIPYWYGRSSTDFQYEMEENTVVIIFCVILWPVTIPLAAAGFVLFNIGRFFNKLGERHKDKKGPVI